MDISTDIYYSSDTPCVVALGCFDGVHLGHASVIKKAKEEANKLSIPLCVWSFSEPPKRFYAPQRISLLTDAKTKEKLIERLGADLYLSIEFNESIAALTPEEFFDKILAKGLKASTVVCGFDFTFGKGGSGNASLLASLCKKASIEFIAVSSVEDSGAPISSSRIRKHLALGEVDKAQRLLGRPYGVTAEVSHGKHLGRDLGFPTINQRIDKSLCIPAHGVYLTRVKFDHNSLFAITNVGTQPTLGGSEIIAETNIFDFSGDLYGKIITVEFLQFLRPERKFKSIEELSNQVHTDIKKAKELIETQKKCAE